ncbi:MAG: PAS domain S-box protein [Dehalococcoidia bacterium]|nr:PAS domain S-box protein [Dehalococcoidia bacterium]
MREPAVPATTEYHLRLIIDQNADGILVVDSSGVIVLANPAAAALFARPAEELVGCEFGYPVVSRETYEVEIVRAGASTVTAELRAVDIVWEGQPAWLVSLRDVTPRREAEIAKQQRIAAEAQLLGVTLAAREIAHLVVNNIAAAYTVLNVFRSAEDIPATYLDLIESAVAGLKAAADHIERLQQVVRIQTKNTPIGPALDLEQST